MLESIENVLSSLGIIISLFLLWTMLRDRAIRHLKFIILTAFLLGFIVGMSTLCFAESQTLTCEEKIDEYKLRLSESTNNLQLCQLDSEAYQQAFIDMHIAYIEHIFNEYQPALEKIALYKKEIRRLKRLLKYRDRTIQR